MSGLSGSGKQRPGEIVHWTGTAREEGGVRGADLCAGRGPGKSAL